MLAPNLLGRHRPTGEQISRQTGLDAKGLTPELLRLKFYCSRTRNIHFFLFFKCLSCALFDCPPSLLLVSLVLLFFFFFFFLFLGFVSFTIVS
jgi:hypothetical protein